MAIASQMMALGIAAEASKAIGGTVAVGLTATGSTQVTALLLPAAINAIATAAAATGVILPSNSTNGDQLAIYNGGANTVNVYPPVGGTINNLAANTAVTIATTKAADLFCIGPLTWFVNAGA
jgi:hypothetical protein